MTTFIVFGGIAVLIGVYFALNWWLAGREGKRAIGRPRDGQGRNTASVDYEAIRDHGAQDMGGGL